MRGTVVTLIRGSPIHKYVHDGRPRQRDEKIGWTPIIYRRKPLKSFAWGPISAVIRG
jgi:hypothetical protein